MSLEERAKILGLKEAGLLIQAIARQLDRSRAVVSSILKSPATYGTVNARANRKKMTARDERRLLRAASNSTKSSRTLRNELNLPISARQTRAYLNGSGFLRHKKIKRQPPLQQRHQDARIKFARSHSDKSANWWGKVVWSDEKRFNCDGPDEIQCFWQDLRREELVLSKRQYEGNGVMVWAAFSAHERTKLVKVTVWLNEGEYVKILEKELLEWAGEELTIWWIFQQDNAPVHAFKVAEKWFNDQGISVLELPACSPDLNPIENLWGILTRAVYANSRQFSTVQELMDCITEFWDNTDPNIVQRLVNSMHNRCIEVIARQGGMTDY